MKFFGATADATQRAYTPNDVAGFFSSDLATDEYNYSSTREDLAMTFEEFMMVHNHAWRRDVAITDNQGIAKISLVIDGKEVAVAYGGTLSYSWNTRKLAKGAHTVTVRVTASPSRKTIMSGR